MIGGEPYTLGLFDTAGDNKSAYTYNLLRLILVLLAPTVTEKLKAVLLFLL